MAQKIVDLEVDEISLVDKASNPGATVLLYKRDENIDKALAGSHEDYISRVSSAWRKSVGEKTGSWVIATFDESLVAEMDGGVVIVPYQRNGEDFTFSTAIPAKETVVAKAKGITKQSAAATPPREDIMEKEIQKLQAEMDAVKAELEAKNKEIETLKSEKDELSKKVEAFENSPEQVEKRKMDELPESLRKRFEAAEEKAKQLEEKQEVREFTEKVREFGMPDEFGPIYRRVHKGQATKEDLDELDAKFKAQHAQLQETGLFKAYGKDGNDGNVEDMADKKLIAKANQLMKEEKDLEFADAMERVCREDPEAYARSCEQSRIR